MMRMLVTGGSGFIGTNFIDQLVDEGIPLINLDINPPKKKTHQPYWQECDILDFDLTRKAFERFQPTHIVHLAARTDTLSNEIEDYKVNTQGTTNILDCVKAIPTSQRLIVTSSQFAFAPPGSPRSDEDYNPIGAYGLSKVLSEKSDQVSCARLYMDDHPSNEYLGAVAPSLCQGILARIKKRTISTS